MNYVILNGIKSTTIKGLLIQSLPSITKPLIRTSVEEIDGRDGDIVNKLGYSAYDKTMSIGLFGDYDVDEVINYFNSEGIVVFSNEIDKFYKYQIIQQIDFERLLRFRTANIVFHVQPFKYSTVDDIFTFSVEKLKVLDFEEQKNGISCICENGLISLTGTATDTTDFYVPIKPVDLDASVYTLQAFTEGSGESACEIRIINNEISDLKTFGETATALEDDGSTYMQFVGLNSKKHYNYLYIKIENNAVINFTLNVNIVDNAVHNFTIFNRGNTISRPKLTIYCNYSVNIYINDIQIFSITAGTTEFVITINGEEMNAYSGNVLKNRSVVGNYNNLILRQGQNKISWDGDVTRIDVENYSRWI